MAKHNDIGKKGEKLAVLFLEKKGLNILETNWRWKQKEIDIIATQNNFIHFIEVKTRTSVYYGFPEESISAKKLKNIMDVSAEYLNANPFWKRVQFDVLSINIVNKEANIFYIEDVYDF